MHAPRKFEIPAIPPEFVMNLKGKQFITANGLIYLGHLQGLKRVDVQVIHVPTREDPSAIVRCEVETDLGVFSDYGEVSPASKGNVGGQYPLSMATTRARNRALRIATGCPLTSYEEMGTAREELGPDDDEAPVSDEQRRLEELYQTLGEAQTLIKERFGVLEPIEMHMTLQQAQARYNELRATYSRLSKQADSKK